MTYNLYKPELQNKQVLKTMISKNRKIMSSKARMVCFSLPIPIYLCSNLSVRSMYQRRRRYSRRE